MNSAFVVCTFTIKTRLTTRNLSVNTTRLGFLSVVPPSFRRAGTDNHAHRDFAQDGGFLCPSEVKYARPKRARNSKGKWKFVVNMDKYSQTIRMEKCL